MMKKQMAFRCFKKNIWLIAAAAVCFILLHFSLPDSKYFSSCANAVRQSRGMDHSLKPRIPDPCLGRYIYMYDLPPRFNQDLVTNCKSLRAQYNICPYLENGGLGSPLFLNDNAEDSESVISGESWYGTHQFLLEMIFHSRMKQYECLTSNSSLASAIYAPFYPGLEVGRYLWGGYNSSVKDAGGLDFTTWLRGRPEWKRMFGWDHFFVSGRISWDFRRPTYMGPDWGSTLMNLPESQNMTMLTVDSSYYANNDFAIPYPTYFHPSNDSEVLQWQKQVRRAKRTHLFAFAGATRTHETSIRGQLISQCKNATRNRCKLVSCAPNDKVNCNRPDHIIKSFMMSEFCLQPPGDSDTRRSSFDAMLAGCIPVFFHPGSAYTQYFWHLPKNYTSYSVFISMEGVKNGTVLVEEVLQQISQDAVTAMREEVLRLIPSIIYARNKLETIEDAFDIAVSGVLQRTQDFRRQIQDGKDPRSRFPEESTWKYYLTGNTEKNEWDFLLTPKQ